jgi:hypothetical protein
MSPLFDLIAHVHIERWVDGFATGRFHPGFLCQCGHLSKLHSLGFCCRRAALWRSAGLGHGVLRRESNAWSGLDLVFRFHILFLSSGFIGPFVLRWSKVFAVATLRNSYIVKTMRKRAFPAIIFA